MPTEVTRTYLQMTSPGELVVATDPAQAGVPSRVERVLECPPSFYRYLYKQVGERYHWFDRRDWSDEQIRGHLGGPGLSLWLLTVGGAPAGYFELQSSGSDDGSVEVAYFGLLPEFIGRGLGKHLLSVAAREAWKGGATRVWLHTCTLDDKAALPNYVARGFRPYRNEVYTVP
jgi:GNAT superfamily N-acetyltransferase